MSETETIPTILDWLLYQWGKETQKLSEEDLDAVAVILRGAYDGLGDMTFDQYEDSLSERFAFYKAKDLPNRRALEIIISALSDYTGGMFNTVPKTALSLLIIMRGKDYAYPIPPNSNSIGLPMQKRQELRLDNTA